MRKKKKKKKKKVRRKNRELRLIAEMNKNKNCEFLYHQASPIEIQLGRELSTSVTRGDRAAWETAA
jgi:hypothetical protein